MDRLFAAKALVANSLDFGRANASFVQSALLDPAAQFIFEDRLSLTLPSAQSMDVSEALSDHYTTALAASTQEGELGLCVYDPENKVILKNLDGTAVLDADGNEVFGRLTKAGAVWTLSFKKGADVAATPASPLACFAFFSIEKALGAVKRIGGTQAIGPAADPRYENHLLGLGDRHGADAVDIDASVASALNIADPADQTVKGALEALDSQHDTLISDLASSATGKGAALVGVEDDAAKFDATTVEGVLAELQVNIEAEATARQDLVTDLASVSASKGASLIGIEDADSQFAAATVEAALKELATGLATEITNRGNADSSLSTSISNLIADLASTGASKGASLIGVQDTANYFTGTNVEAILAELKTMITTSNSDGGQALQQEIQDRIAGDAATLSSAQTDATTKANAAQAAAQSYAAAQIAAIDFPEEVHEYANLASFPAVGAVANLYVDLAQNDVYRFETIPGVASYDWQVGPSGNFATIEAALMSPTVQNGHKIFVQAGTYTLTNTLTISKQVKLYGAGIGQTILQTAGTGTDPVNAIQIMAANVLLKDMTIKHRKTTNTSVETAVVISGGGFPASGIDGAIIDSCRIESVEFAIAVRGSNWKIANNQLVYNGPGSNSTRRLIGVYGNSGTSFAVNNVLYDSPSSAGGNTRFIYLTSSGNAESYSGTVVVEGNTVGAGVIQQFMLQDAFSGAMGGFNWVVKNNVMNETSLFSGIYVTMNGQADLFGQITVSGNTLTGSHGGTPIGTKGVFAVDGTGVTQLRMMGGSLPLHMSNNTITTTNTFRTDYTSVSGTDVGRNTAGVTGVTVSKDSTIPSSPAVPSTPSAVSDPVNQYVLLSNKLASTVSTLQSEVDAIETGAGLGSSGTYTANGASNYLAAATSLKDADNKLDVAVKGIDNRVGVLEAKTWYKGSFVVSAAMLDSGDPAYRVQGDGYLHLDLDVDFSWKNATAPALHNGASDPSFTGFIGGMSQDEGVGETFVLSTAGIVKVKADDVWDTARIRVMFFK